MVVFTGRHKTWLQQLWNGSSNVVLWKSQPQFPGLTPGASNIHSLWLLVQELLTLFLGFCILSSSVLIFCLSSGIYPAAITLIWVGTLFYPFLHCLTQSHSRIHISRPGIVWQSFHSTISSPKRFNTWKRGQMGVIILTPCVKGSNLYGLVMLLRRSGDRRLAEETTQQVMHTCCRAHCIGTQEHSLLRGTSSLAVTWNIYKS